MIRIRRVETIVEYRAVEQLQREIWGLDDAEIVPDHMLITVQKNGGLLLGAFETPPGGETARLVGFVLGFVGLTAGGKVKHCSHMAGVIPAYQNQRVGYRLKLEQREQVLTQGFDLITWTFDPLESRNAYLNFHKLGVTCRTYLRDLYGSMRDALNLGLPSDRFQVEWHITSKHVVERLRGQPAGPSLAQLMEAGAPLLNPALVDGGPCPSSQVGSPAGEQILIQIPVDFQALRSSEMALARAWREQTRDLFEAAFAQGYVVVDLLHQAGQSYYLLQKEVR